MKVSSILDLKTFVPAKDHELAKRFYIDLGFKLNWSNDEVDLPPTAVPRISSKALG